MFSTEIYTVFHRLFIPIDTENTDAHCVLTVLYLRPVENYTVKGACVSPGSVPRVLTFGRICDTMGAKITTTGDLSRGITEAFINTIHSQYTSQYYIY